MPGKKYRFAEDTTVPVAKSQEEVRHLLVDKMKAQKYGVIWDGTHEIIRFEMVGMVMQLEVPASPDEKERMRLWRCVLLHIKSMWESIQNKIASIEQILLPYVLLPTGRTVGQELPGEIRKAISAGRMPELLPNLRRTPQ